MILIIVESPTKAKTLGKFLGTDYEVLATKGHIKDLPKSKLSIDVENEFEPMYEFVEKKKDVIDKIREVSKDAKKIFLATDPDREGEAISSHVSEILGDKHGDNIFRIVFHEITKEAVTEAIANPREIDINLVNAQTARRVLDRLVGYKLSPLLWKKVRRGLSAGRVQTVAVRLIVEKEKEVGAFKSEEYWEIFCTVKKLDVDKEEGTFDIELVKVNGKKVLVGSKVDADKIVADLEKGSYKVSDIRKREITKHAYPPFTTSTMTQTAARLFAWTAKRTMKVAQSLYEEGLITYHRTDSFNLAAGAVEKGRKYIKDTFGENYLPEKPNFYKTKSRSAQEAHEAIRPTSVNDKTLKEGHTSDEEKLYGIIWKRFLSCQMKPSIYDETVCDILSEVGENKYTLRVGGQILRFDGWKVLYNKAEDELVRLPDLKVDEDLKLIKVKPLQKFTQAPARYSEASLIKMLETLGIGRPSTYAPIISTIQIRQYVEKKEGRFFPTNVGIAVNNFLVPHFGTVFDYQFTAQMEKGLDDVAGGEKKWKNEIKEFYNPFEIILKDVEKTAERVKIDTEKVGRKCPDCKDGELVIRIGRFGKFISCSNFPECKHTEKFVEKMHMKCPECKKGDIVVKFTKTKRRFYGCNRYPKCSWASWRKPIKEEKKK
jgi:DNA topoisomerase I